jgi:hypothetical protein
MGGFVRRTPGSDIWGDGCSIPRHRHDRPYAALVLVARDHAVSKSPAFY